MNRRRTEFDTVRAIAVVTLVLAGLAVYATGQQPPPPAKVIQQPNNPASWGGNHVGKPIPEFVHGDECLFCHRNNIGVTWQQNAHGVTIRHREDAPELQGMVNKQAALSTLASQIEYFLGSRHRVRFLKKDGYGRFSILNTQAVLGRETAVEKWLNLEKLTWDKDRFANRCVGCHATGIDAATKTFVAFGLDCYVCHGDVTLDHTKETALIWLSKKRRDDARAITSICAQCHLRFGKSRSTGLPYPNNFIAGDNLFQDYEVDFSRADAGDMNPADQHIADNVRDVVVSGQLDVTCLSCHQVHANSARHHSVRKGPICQDCHEGTNYVSERKNFVAHSALCEY